MRGAAAGSSVRGSKILKTLASLEQEDPASPSIRPSSSAETEGTGADGRWMANNQYLPRGNVVLQVQRPDPQPAALVL